MCPGTPCMVSKVQEGEGEEVKLELLFCSNFWNGHQVSVCHSRCSAFPHGLWSLLRLGLLSSSPQFFNNFHSSVCIILKDFFHRVLIFLLEKLLYGYHQQIPTAVKNNNEKTNITTKSGEINCGCFSITIKFPSNVETSNSLSKVPENILPIPAVGRLRQ